MCRGLYSPKISEELIPELYQKAQRYGIRMTTLADILIREGLKNANITLALEARPEAKKVKTAFNRHYDRAVAEFFKGQADNPGLPAPLSSSQPVKHHDRG